MLLLLALLSLLCQYFVDVGNVVVVAAIFVVAGVVTAVVFVAVGAVFDIIIFLLLLV